MSVAPAPLSLPLWQLLAHSARALHHTLQGQAWRTVAAGVPEAARPGVQALVFAALRHWGRACALRRLLARRAPPPEVDRLLCLALALSWDVDQAPYAPHTLVNQTVQAARQRRPWQGQAGFLNACLRRFLRERDALVAQTEDDPQAVWNHPLWWIERLQQDHPDDWQTLLQLAQKPPPMTLRVQSELISVADYQQALARAGWPQAQPVGLSGLVLPEPLPVQALPGFDQGWVSVQDAAAQMAAPLLLRGLQSPRPRILDACAAPGGKTAHLLELCPQAHVLALDVAPERVERIHQNLQRLRLDKRDVQVQAGDASTPAAWWDGQPFDAVLLDAPCTASGIVRRHPDVRWLRRPGDSAQLAQTQTRLLQALWPLVAAGGRLLYATCSVFKDEGERVVQTFLARNTDALLQPSPGHLIPGRPVPGPALGDNGWGEHDGFFYALLVKALP